MKLFTHQIKPSPSYRQGNYGNLHLGTPTNLQIHQWISSFSALAHIQDTFNILFRPHPFRLDIRKLLHTLAFHPLFYKNILQQSYSNKSNPLFYITYTIQPSPPPHYILSTTISYHPPPPPHSRNITLLENRAGIFFNHATPLFYVPVGAPTHHPQ